MRWIVFCALISAPAQADPELGRRLFHDPALSANGAMSCADCHDPERGFTSGAVGGRTPPPLHVATQLSVWGWDGRHESLRAAILAPLTDPREMANPDADAAARRVGLVDADALADAIGAYLATLDSPPPTPEGRGAELFRSAGCADCHSGPLLTDEGFHNLGLSAFGEPSQDLGRMRVTGDPADAGRFRTPSLRHVAQTAPYMHTGHFRTLEGVVRFYAQGGGKVWARNAAEADRPMYPEAARLDPRIRPLDLSEDDIAALVAFLKQL
ncbi:cytochrome c peroxidase [Cereibacter sp. SYSU M97828]|nr:cytochrome c peroxidase [Cereibacter flavus]